MDLSELGQQFGLSPEQMEAAIGGLAPVIAAGMKRQASGGGLESIFEALQQGQQGSGFGSAADAGNVVLGQVFGSKDVSRGVAQQVADTSGIPAAILKKLLPIIATFIITQMLARRGGASTGMAVAGWAIFLAIFWAAAAGQRQQPQTSPGGGGLGDILGDILGGGQRQQQQPQTAPGGGLGDILGDLLGNATTGQGQRQPQQGGGIGDILGQILGGGSGGQRVSAADDLLAGVERALRQR